VEGNHEDEAPDGEQLFAVEDLGAEEVEEDGEGDGDGEDIVPLPDGDLVEEDEFVSLGGPLLLDGL